MDAELSTMVLRLTLLLTASLQEKKVFANQNVLSESAAEPDSVSDLHIVRAVFGTPFWPKSSRNDRFYKGLAPKRGWNLGPAGRPPAGQPGPAKKKFFSIQD